MLNEEDPYLVKDSRSMRSHSHSSSSSLHLQFEAEPSNSKKHQRLDRSRSTLLEKRKLSECCYAELLKKTPVEGRVAELASVRQHEPCKSEITRFLVVMSLAMVASTSGQYMNVCTYLFEAKYGWDTKAERDRN